MGCMKKIDNKLHNRLTKKRERRRLRTLRGLRKHKLKIIDNINEVTIDSELDFLQDQEATLKLLKDIQHLILYNKKFSINHKDMKNITKESLLLLTAEIERCASISNKKLKPNYKLFPKDHNINLLLDKIGYWKHFNMPIKKSTDLQCDDLYLQITSDTKVKGQKIGELIEFFETLVHFEPFIRDKFSDALMEAASNTVEHAYSDNIQNSIGKWWLTASLNKNTNEISFVFYDQGDGILNTLEKSNKSIKFKKLVDEWINIFGYSKAEILKKLVTTNLSQYKDDRRGNGLVSFKSFIDEVDNGELSISTDDFTYFVSSDKIVKYKEKLNGTLLSWRINISNDNNKNIYIKEN